MSTRKETRKEETRKRRKDRSEFGDFRKRLSIPNKIRKWAERNNKELHFFNDVGGRIHQAFNNDWSFVRFQGEQIGEVDKPEADGDCYMTVVGKGEGGEPIKAYLMAKDKDWHYEDFQEKQKEVDEIDKAISAGKTRADSKDLYVKDVKYEPKGKLVP